MSNTISNEVYRSELFATVLQERLVKTTVANGISRKFEWGVKEIENPYGSESVAVSGAITGTYTVDDYTTTDDTMTTNIQVSKGEHVFNFEKSLTNFNMFMERREAISDGISEKIDAEVLGIYEAGAGTVIANGAALDAANVEDTLVAVSSLGAGYKVTGQRYMVITPTELPVLKKYAANAGFATADATLNNGKVDNIFGVDIYVVAAGQMTANTLLAGVSGVNSFLIADGMDVGEKEVSGKTGKEVYAVAMIGAKVWKQKETLTARITLA